MSQQTITLDPATLSPEQLVALVQAGLISLPENGSAPSATPAPKTPAKGKGKKEPWTNAVGFTCPGGEFPAYTSSVAIRRHIAGSCDCKKENGKCRWAQKGRLTADSFNSRPDVLGVERLEEENRVVFVGDGGVVIEDVVLS